MTGLTDDNAVVIQGWQDPGQSLQKNHASAPAEGLRKCLANLSYLFGVDRLLLVTKSPELVTAPRRLPLKSKTTCRAFVLTPYAGSPRFLLGTHSRFLSPGSSPPPVPTANWDKPGTSSPSHHRSVGLSLRPEEEAEAAPLARACRAPGDQAARTWPGHRADGRNRDGRMKKIAGLGCLGFLSSRPPAGSR